MTSGDSEHDSSAGDGCDDKWFWLMTSKDAEIFTDSWRWRRRWSPCGSCDQLQLMVGQQSVNAFKRLTQVIVECKAEDQTFAQC